MAELLDDQVYQPQIIYKKKKDNYFLHIGLLIATIITTIFAGVQWTTGIMAGPYEFSMLKSGLLYSAAIIFISRVMNSDTILLPGTIRLMLRSLFIFHFLQFHYS